MTTHKNNYGTSRLDPMGLMRLRSFKPDERRIKLYERVKQHNKSISGRQPAERIPFEEALNEWAGIWGYSSEEMNKVKMGIRQ